MPGSRTAPIRRPARLLLSGAAALALLWSATACAPEPQETAETPRPTATSEAPSSPTPAPTPAPAPTPTEEPWERFSDPRFPQSFEVPSDWTVQERGSAYSDTGLSQFELLDAAGERRLYFSSDVQGLGGACGALPALAVEELDSEPLDLPGYAPPASSDVELVAPRFVYRASQLDDRVVASLSVSNDVPIDSCVYYNLLHLESGAMVFADIMQVDSAPPGPTPPRTFASMVEAEAFMDSDEYATLKRVLLSLRLGA